MEDADMLKIFANRTGVARVSLAVAVMAYAANVEAGGPDLVYVANMDTHTISVLDGRSLQPITTIDAKGQNTHDLCLSPDGRWLFATNMGTGTLSVVDTSSHQVVETIPTGKTTHAIAITPDGKELWVNAGAEDHLPIVSTSERRVIGRVPLGEPIATGHIWFSPDGKTAWATSRSSGRCSSWTSRAAASSTRSRSVSRRHSFR